MTIPTILTQGSTTHLKEGLPVTTVSNLGAMTPASESLIMSIKKTADDALAAAGGGGGGGGGGSGDSQEDIDNLKNRMTNVETKTTQNASKITALETKEDALSKRVDGHDTEIADLKQKNTEQNDKITAVENSVNSMKSDVESNKSDIAKVDSKLTSLEASIDDKLSGFDTLVNDLEKKHDSDISKIDSLLDTTVITDVDLEQQDTGEYKLSTSSANLKTQDVSSESFLIDLADENKAGLMPKESYKQLEEISKTVESLSQGGVWRGTYDTYEDLIQAYPDLDVSATNWTVNDYVEVEDDSEHDGNATRYIVSIVDGKKELVFQKISTVKIEQATSENLGVVKGSENSTDNKYKIFVEQDGTMSLIGGADLDKSISDLDSKIDDTSTNLQTNIDTVKTDLTSKIDDLDTTLTDKITDLETKHNTDISTLDTKIDDTKTELQTNIDTLESDLKKEIEDVDKALSDRIDEVEYKALPYNSFVGKSITQYTFCEYDGLIFQAIADIEEVPEDFDETQWKQIGGRKYDEITINTNSDGKLQTIGYIDKNTGEPEYNWTGPYSKWVDDRNSGKIPDDWICKITDDYNANKDNHKVFYHILELWWSYRMDDYQDGAYAADGREFYKSDFKSEDESSNPYNILVEQGIAITYEQYQAIIDKYGFCGKFAIDTENEKFKLPTLRDCYARAGENIGETLGARAPNIIGSYPLGLASESFAKYTGAFYVDNSSSIGNNGKLAAPSSGNYAYASQFDASRSSSVYQDGDELYPNSVVLKPMIQLINYIPKDVSIDFVNNTERQIQDLKAVINTLNAKLIEVSNSFIPDYGEQIQINSGYVTPKRGIISIHINSYADAPEILFNGTRVWYGTGYANERMANTAVLTVEAGVTVTYIAKNYSYLAMYFTPFKTQPELGGGIVFPEDEEQFAKTVNDLVDTKLLTSNTMRLVAEKKATNDDPSYYRLYSNGYVVQGGYNYVGSGAIINQFFTQALLIEMADINYRVLLDFADPTHTYPNYRSVFLLSDNYTTSTFNYAMRDGNGYNYKANSSWEVKGYAKVAPPANLDVYRNYLADYVTEESYLYIDELNYSSWQKYASGKVIINGLASGKKAAWNKITLPVEMADTHYSINATRGVASDTASTTCVVRNPNNINATDPLHIIEVYIGANNDAGGSTDIFYTVIGKAKTI